MEKTRRGEIAIIGGGIFGACSALELSRSFDVTLFERGAALLAGATYANHNRHHYGFHYPRSPETALQCLRSREDFESAYGSCLDWEFDNFYGVAKSGSKTTPGDYMAFCRDHGLEFEEAYPPKGVLDRSKLALCLRVKEAVYDVPKLRRMVTERLGRAKSVRVALQHEVVGAAVDSDGSKVLSVAADGAVRDWSFDFVVNATYADTNRFRRWLGFPGRPCQFNLQELDVVELPLAGRIGVTIQDGPFPSIIPLAHTRQYLMAHVIESQLIREISLSEAPLLHRVNYVESNWPDVLDACAAFIPVLRRATYVRSIFVDRVVDSTQLGADARLTEVTSHGSGCWSLFAAKVITCVSTAKKLCRMVRDTAA